MANTVKTMIVTGGSQGIGAGVVKAFLGRGYNVVANSRSITKSGAFEVSDKLALVDGDIAQSQTAAKITEVAKSKFGSIDALVNNAGIYFSKPFTDYTTEDLKSLVSVNIEGFLFITQLAIRQMLAQKTGGSIVNITAALAGHPIAGINSAVPMITKGGLDAVTRSLAMEYVKQGIRVNAVAPGTVNTPMHGQYPHAQGSPEGIT
jgi:NAD(P)-dependent dehydrogenase (short-subunit alcohol dehydrogenase family)